MNKLPASGEPTNAAAPINSNSKPKTLFRRCKPSNSTAIIGRNAAKQAKKFVEKQSKFRKRQQFGS